MDIEQVSGFAYYSSLVSKGLIDAGQYLIQLSSWIQVLIGLYTTYLVVRGNHTVIKDAVKGVKATYAGLSKWWHKPTKAMLQEQRVVALQVALHSIMSELGMNQCKPPLPTDANCLGSKTKQAKIIDGQPVGQFVDQKDGKW